MADDSSTPWIERIRHEIRRRDLAIASVLRLTPHMIRVTLSGDELADFAEKRGRDHTLAFADAHYLLALAGAGRLDKANAMLRGMIKVFVPGPDGEPQTRD